MAREVDEQAVFRLQNCGKPLGEQTGEMGHRGMLFDEERRLVVMVALKYLGQALRIIHRASQ
jgi:hypothetical protein